MFLHGRLGSHPRQHAVPGDLRQERRGRLRALRYLGFYVLGGFAAMMTQTAVTLLFGTAAAARVPKLGASGAIAAVLGAYFVLYPDSRIRTWFFRSSWSGSRPGSILGVWFLLPARRGQLRARPLRRERGRRRLLRARRRLRLRRGGDGEARPRRPRPTAEHDDAAPRTHRSDMPSDLHHSRGQGDRSARSPWWRSASASGRCGASSSSCSSRSRSRPRSGPAWNGCGRHRTPESVAILLHFIVVGVAVALLVWLAVPPAIHQIGARARRRLTRMRRGTRPAC